MTIHMTKSALIQTFMEKAKLDYATAEDAANALLDIPDLHDMEPQPSRRRKLLTGIGWALVADAVVITFAVGAITILVNVITWTMKL